MQNFKDSILIHVFRKIESAVLVYIFPKIDFIFNGGQRVGRNNRNRNAIDKKPAAQPQFLRRIFYI